MNGRQLCLEQACKLSGVCELARLKLSGLYCNQVVHPNFSPQTYTFDPIFGQFGRIYRSTRIQVHGLSIEKLTQY